MPVDKNGLQYKIVKVDLPTNHGLCTLCRQLKLVIPLQAIHPVIPGTDLCEKHTKMFKEERVSVPDEQKLIEDLAVYTYDLNSKGQHMVERKKDIKKRLGRSTDYGDACVMGIWGQRSAKNPLTLPEKNNEQLDYNPLDMELLTL